MRYHIDFTQAARDYLRIMPVSRTGRVKIFGFIHSSISRVPDAVRNDPAARLPGSRRFQMQFVFTDGGRVRLADFVIDDSAAAYGVLIIEYLDVR